MSIIRTRRLEKNITKLFVVKALLSANFFSLLSTLFFIHRGLDLSQVMLLPVAWAAGSLLSEIPSSYLADKLGRKKTLIIGALLGVVYAGTLIFSDNFYLFILANFIFGVEFAMFSGTDEALLYDTKKELGSEHKTLDSLANYYSARNVLKIIGPLFAAVIARDLVDMQYVTVIIVDLVLAIVSFVILVTIVEPNHYMDLEKQEAGILRDAWKIITSDTRLLRAILSRTVIFIAIFIIYRFHQQYFLDRGITILTLGIVWSIINIGMFGVSQLLRKLSHTSVPLYINRINMSLFVLLVVLTGSVVFGWTYIILGCTAVLFLVEAIRWPLYSQYFNEQSFSFNRATTLSLTNFVKNVLDIPIFFVAYILIDISIILPFIFACVLTLVALVLGKVVTIPHRTSTCLKHTNVTKVS